MTPNEQVNHGLLVLIYLLKNHDAFPMVLMACMGGMVKVLNDKARGRKLSSWTIFSNIITSGFVGLLLFFLTKDTEISQAWCCFLSGAAGSSATQIMPAIQEVVTQMVDKLVESNEIK